MEEVRIPLLNKKFFLEKVDKEPAMKGEKCLHLLLETTKYLLDPMLIKQSKRTVPRKSYNNTTIEPDSMTSNPTPIAAAQPPKSTPSSGEVIKPAPGPSNPTPSVSAIGGPTTGMFLKLFLIELNILHAIVATSWSWVNKLKTLIHLLTI